ncbi:MAG: TetR family transcriptional regulator [Betaproteobacteria bacterium]|nr:TetR family transcriptional regulator [Betaproteobacteria bacterium]
MVIKQRAMLEEDKQLRRQAILSAAAALLLQHPERLASVQDVALQSGLAKGTMYLYFRTKEEIYLAVHEQQTHQFFDTLEALLARERSRPSLKRLTRNVVEAIRQHPSFLPLAIQCPEFERNADLDVVAHCKAGIGARLQHIGAAMEITYPRLKKGDGARLLIRSYGLMLGLWQLTAPTPVRERLLERAELAVFRLDYLVQLEAALYAMWRGTVDE